MESRSNGYALPQFLETETGSSMATVSNAVTDFLSIFSQYKGKKSPLVDHAFSWQKTQYQVYSGFLNVDGRPEQFYNGRFFHYHGSLSNAWVKFDGFTSTDEVYNKALGKLFDKLSASVDLSVDTWQYKQTLQLGKDIVALLRYVRTFNVPKLFKSYKQYQSARRRLAPKTFREKRQPVTWRKYARNTGSTWLSFSYGVRPLMQDIFATFDAMRAPKRMVNTFHVRSRMTNRWLIKEPTSILGYPAWQETREGNSSAQCSFKVSFVVSESALDTLKRFTTMDPKRFLWENIPFSFVADWVYNLGGYMEIYEKAQNNAKFFAGGTVSTALKGYCTGVARKSVHSASEDPFWTADGHAESYLQQTTYQRSVLTSVPFPRSPTFNLDMSSPMRALNALSLLLIQFKGK